MTRVQRAALSSEPVVFTQRRAEVEQRGLPEKSSLAQWIYTFKSQTGNLLTDMSYVTKWVFLSVSRLRRKSHHSSVSFDSCKTQEFDYVQVKEELGYHPWAAEIN